MQITEARTLPVPAMPLVMGYVVRPYPQVRHLDRRARSVIEQLEAVASLHAHLAFEPDIAVQDEKLEEFEELLGRILQLQETLTSRGARYLWRDIKRLLPHRGDRLEKALTGALHMLDEFERFIRDAVLAETGPDLLPLVEPGEPGPSEPFDF